MADGGYTPSEIDRFNLADVNLLYAQWAKRPTVRQILAAVHGIKPPSGPAPTGGAPGVTTMTRASIEAAHPGGLIRG